MQRTIDWINQNSGFIMGLLTLIYVLATIVYVLSTRELVKGQQELLAMTVKVEAERARPRVWFSIHQEVSSKGMLVFASLKNHGAGPALNITTTVTPPLLKVSFGKNVESSFVQYPVSFLAPGREELDAFDSGAGFTQLNGDKQFKVRICYEDVYGVAFENGYTLDTTGAADRNYFII